MSRSSSKPKILQFWCYPKVGPDPGQDSEFHIVTQKVRRQLPVHGLHSQHRLVQGTNTFGARSCKTLALRARVRRTDQPCAAGRSCSRKGRSQRRSQSRSSILQSLATNLLQKRRTPTRHWTSRSRSKRNCHPTKHRHLPSPETTQEERRLSLSRPETRWAKKKQVTLLEGEEEEQIVVKEELVADVEAPEGAASGAPEEFAIAGDSRRPNFLIEEPQQSSSPQLLKATWPAFVPAYSLGPQS